MKIAPRQADDFVKSPPGAIVAVLVYGPDAGLVAERASAIAATRVADLADPFRVARLSGDGLAADPARLMDEVQALSLTGGGRVVRVANATDGAASLFQSLLDQNDPGAALVVAEAGPLGPRSSLRKLFEGADNAAALACYEDDARTLPPVIRQMLADAGLAADADAIRYLADHLGSDRAVTRREVEKLALYVGGAPGARVTLADVEASVGDSASLDVETIALAAASGDYANLDTMIERAGREGAHPVQVIRIAIRHFQRLHLARGLMEADRLSAGDAMKKLRPAPMFKIERQFASQLASWDTVRLGRALDVLTEAEVQVKSTGMPIEAVAHRALMRIAGQARRSA